MRIALLTTDNREHYRQYHLPTPYFGTAIEALLQGLRDFPELEVHLISCTQKPMPAPEKLAPNLWFHLLPVPKIGWLRTGYQGCIRAIRKKLRELQPDVVHGQGTERECGLAAAFSGYPNIITIHGNMRAVAGSLRARPGSFLWLAAKLESFTLPRTSGVLCNSAYTESLVAAQVQQTWRVPNAVRSEFFETPLVRRPPAPKPVLLNIGFVDARKRQALILNLARQLHEQGHSFELQFIGALDRTQPSARELLRQLEVAENLGYARYLGSKTLLELLAVMSTASALLHLPAEEAFGLVAAEGLARNLKFFGGDVGGLSEIASGVESAELFPLGDEARFIERCGRWLEGGSPLADNSAEIMRARYHPKVIAARHVEIYSELLADSRR